MTICLTGVAGLIGSNLAHWILENTEHTVIGIDNLSGGSKSNLPRGRGDGRFVFAQVDVNDAERIENIFETYNIDTCYHFAAYAAENLSPFIRRFNYTNNVVGTASIVNACINSGVKRIVFTSSIAVYGHGEPPFKETDYPEPKDCYGIGKWASEQDIKVAGEQHGLDWCIVRPFNVYGVRQNIFDKYRNVIGIFMWQYLNDKPMTIFGDGKQKRSFTQINDILEPLFIAGTSPKCSKEIINLGSTFSYEVKHVAEMLQEIMLGGEIEYLEKRFEAKIAFCDNSKAKELLGYKDKTSLYVGLKEMYQWAKTLNMKPQSQWGKYEVNKGMYNAWKK